VSIAAEIVKEFLSENYIQEVEISPDDEPTLLTGGNESPIQKFQSEYGADLQVTRNRFVVVVRGRKDNVEAATTRLNQFLHGGDGYTVSRISVTEQALGVVIGKNGAKRAELEKLHEGVHLYIHRSNRITIRGPDAGVEACRVDILRLVSSVKIQQVMKLTSDERMKLSDPEIIRKAIQGIPVQVTLEDDSLKIRGIFADVRDAQAMLKEQILGFYEAHVELEASQVSCVRRACRDPSHFERMKAASNADINLDIPNNKIVLTGKKGNVRKAKDLVVGFLEFLIPADFARISLIKPLHTTVGDPAALAEVSAISGANVFLDRDLSALIVQSSNAGKVKKASEILKDKIEKANKLAFLITFPASESWVIPLVIGKGGNRVNALRLDAGCNIDIDKIERTITITGDKEENVSKARELLSNVIEEARRQCCFIDIPEEAVAAFLGRGGSHIRAFASEYDIECDRMRKSPGKIRITGEEAKVQAAKKALETWIEQWEVRESGKTIKINKMSIPAVLGKGGSVISALQREFKIKVEIDRDEMTLTVRGSTEEMREKAIAKINHIISEDQDRANNRQGKFDGNGFPKREGDISVGHENGPTLDNDRSSEFARRPVGLTVVEQEVTKANRQRKSKERDISDDSTLQVGSPAGRNLFNLLSDSFTIVNCENINTSVSYNPINLSLMNEEQWDSSTLSSLAADSSLLEDDNKNVDVAKKYVKSASGFSVRV
jgi:rRNA processing protein Krr1/Pno1